MKETFPNLPRRGFPRRLARLLLPILCAVPLGAILGFALTLAEGLPEIEALESYRPKEPARIIDRRGETLKTLYEERREWVDYERIPQHLISAILAVEDRQFFDHMGINFKGLSRAILSGLKNRKFTQGGSSITQQLAKNLFLTPERSFRRKAREAYLSYLIERRYPKERILELYLNQVYLGSGNYGVAAAARSYFGKEIEKVSVSEAALLAGLPKAPSAYSPRSSMEKATARRNLVLDALAETNAYPRALVEELKSQPIRIVSRSRVSQAPYFVEEVRLKLERTLSERYGPRLGDALLYGGGLTIRTTLDLQAQRAAEAAVQRGIADYGIRWGIAKDDPEIWNSTVPPTIDWSNPASFDRFPQTALLAIEPQTGAVLAMVGGTDYAASPFNRSIRMLRQPGSAFKPILYSAAFMDGYRQSDILWDAPLSFHIGESIWSPENYSGEFKGPMTLKYAVQYSKNLPAIRMLRDLGINKLRKMARRLGVSNPIRPELASALGANEMTLAELTGAVGVFAADGLRCDLRIIDSVLTPDGRALYEDPLQCATAMPAQEAFLMTDLLGSIISQGTGWRARPLLEHTQLGGKTGTSNANRDAWFVGITPEVAVGVWVGYDLPRPLGDKETGSRAALPIWAGFLAEVVPNATRTEFRRPSDIEFAEIDLLTGRAVKGGSPTAFIRGTAPQSTGQGEAEGSYALGLGWSFR